MSRRKSKVCRCEQCRCSVHVKRGEPLCDYCYNGIHKEVSPA